MTIRKTTRDIVGSSVLLGLGSGIAINDKSIIPPGAVGMYGAVIPAAYGMEVLSMVDKGSKKIRRRR